MYSIDSLPGVTRKVLMKARSPIPAPEVARAIIGRQARPRSKPLVEYSAKRTVEDRFGIQFQDSKHNRSVHDPGAMFIGLAKYLTDVADGSIDSDALRDAKALTLKAFGGDGSLQPLRSKSELKRALKLEKFSGAPHFVSKEHAFERDYVRYQKMARKNNPYLQPCIGLHRTQFGVDGPKTRLVWGYPLSMTILEARFSRPLIERFLGGRSPMPIGLNAGEISCLMTPIENRLIRYGLDFSAFDSSLPAWMIKFAFSVLKTWFRLSDEDLIEWRIAEQYFIHTPIIMPDGCIYHVHRGVPSGSYFTQLVDSVCNYLITQYCVIRLRGKAIPARDIIVLGDDSVFGLNEYISVKAISRVAIELGVTVNVLKTMTARNYEPVHFLGRVWEHGAATRPIEEVMQRWVYPERFADVPKEIRMNDKLVAYSVNARSGFEFMCRLRDDYWLRSLRLTDVSERNWTGSEEVADIYSGQKRKGNALNYLFYGPLAS